jgi:hypothetical protein
MDGKKRGLSGRSVRDIIASTKSVVIADRDMTSGEIHLNPLRQADMSAVDLH